MTDRDDVLRKIRALMQKTVASPDFWKFGSIAALLVVGGIAWLIVNGQRQEALRKQEYEQQRQAEDRREAQQAERQAKAREAAQRQAAQQEEAQREGAQRQAAIAVQQTAAEREVAAERAAVIPATDLSFGNVTLQNTPRDIGFDLTGKITNHSGQTLRYLEFEVTLEDCPVGPGQCQVVKQQSEKPIVEIPPNQTRTFTAHLDFPNLPQNQQDQQFFSWRIITGSSCSQLNLSAHNCRPQSAL
jgi:multidrug efflux pump subunit AcrA (membrane-fusion protein)